MPWHQRQYRSRCFTAPVIGIFVFGDLSAQSKKGIFRMEYLAGVTGSILSMIFIIFAIATVGYLVGSVSIKGISLGTAGVLLAALA